MPPAETVTVETSTVACDGGTELGHPVVYLNLGAQGETECPYCGRCFVLAPRPGAAIGGGH
jgi:uncharacterized Zn-finger protein